VQAWGHPSWWPGPPQVGCPCYGVKLSRQKGAKGFGLEWSEAPDDRIPHRPEGECQSCGRDLGEATDLGVADVYQQVEVPLVTARREQHEMHAVRCGCGKTHVAARPGGAGRSAIGIGPNLRALVVYLMVFQHVPVERCQRLVADVTGAQVSVGFVHGMVAECGDAVVEATKVIWTLITLAHVVGLDETTLRCGPKGIKRYVLSASTELYTAFFLGRRDLRSFADFGVLSRLRGVAVHDRYRLYFHKLWSLAAHQVCCAHLLRDLQDAAECYPGEHWPTQAQRALRGLITAWHEATDAGQARIPACVCDPLIAEFRQAVVVGLAQVRRVPGPRNTTKQPVGRDLLEFCRDHPDWVLGFCLDTRIWPTNNISERELRPLKTQQKISGRFTSEQVTQHRLNIRAYIDTARKHGHNVMDVLRRAITGQAWMPPTPAPT
jgi:transposase